MAININPEITGATKEMIVTPAKQKAKKLRNKVSRKKQDKSPPAPTTQLDGPNHRTAINPGLTELAKDIFDPAVHRLKQFRKRISMKSKNKANAQNVDGKSRGVSVGGDIENHCGDPQQLPSVRVDSLNSPETVALKALSTVDEDVPATESLNTSAKPTLSKSCITVAADNEPTPGSSTAPPPVTLSLSPIVVVNENAPTLDRFLAASDMVSTADNVTGTNAAGLTLSPIMQVANVAPIEPDANLPTIRFSSITAVLTEPDYEAFEEFADALTSLEDRIDSLNVSLDHQESSGKQEAIDDDINALPTNLRGIDQAQADIDTVRPKLERVDKMQTIDNIRAKLEGMIKRVAKSRPEDLSSNSTARNPSEENRVEYELSPYSLPSDYVRVPAGYIARSPRATPSALRVEPVHDSSLPMEQGEEKETVSAPRSTPHPFREAVLDAPRPREKEAPFGPILQIQEEKYVNLAKRVLNMPDASPQDIYVKGEANGMFNLVKFVHCKPQGKDYAIKVPGAGWGLKWTPERQYILRSEAATLELIREETEGQFPAPRLVDFDDGTTNEIGAPYIFMSRLPGCSAEDIWYDYKDDGYGFYSARSTEKEHVRETFLWSLAKYMGMLQIIHASTTGMLVFENGGNTKFAVGTWFSVNPISDEAISRESHNETRRYYEEAIETKFPEQRRDTNRKGAVQFLRYVLDSKPFCASIESGDQTKWVANEEAESFVLTHADFNIQNILCDPVTGEVTGIIDWEGAHFVPRAVGYASLPLFLRDDWSSNYDCVETGDDGYRPLPTWKIDKYRRVYAKAMTSQNKGHFDGSFTYKSAMYTAFHTCLYPEHNTTKCSVPEFIGRVLLSIIPFVKFTEGAVLKAIGEGDEYVATTVRDGILELMAPDSFINPADNEGRD